MKRLTTFALLALSLHIMLSGQVNRTGNPVIRNISHLEYEASEINWCIIQDSRGVMYFGNDDRGILEYDGQSWRRIPIPNNSTVRSMAIDDSGTIYVGAVGEFGYLFPDDQGTLKYRSLVHMLDPDDRVFGDIWKTYVINDTVYFASYYHIYIYDQAGITRRGTTDGATGSISPNFTFVIDDELYTGTFVKGLIRQEKEGYTVVENGGFFAYMIISAILPWDDQHVLICTRHNGVFLYNKSTGEITDNIFSRETHDYLKEHIIYDGTTLPGGQFGFATDSGGAVIVGRDGEIRQLATVQTGLQHNQVAAIYSNHHENAEMPLWLALTNGLSYVQYQNPVKGYGEERGLTGIVNDIIEFEGTIYVGTYAGLFYLDYDETGVPLFVRIEEIRQNTTSLCLMDIPGKGQRLMAGTQGDIFEIDRNGNAVSVTAQLEGRTHNSFSLFPSSLYQGRLYAGTSDNLVILDYSDGRWTEDVISSNDEIRSIREDENGDLWMGTYVTGVLRISFYGQDTIINNYSHEHGLPASYRNMQVQGFEEEVLFATEEGVFLFDEGSERFYPDPRFIDKLKEPGAGVYRIADDEQGDLWVLGYSENLWWVERLRRQEDGSFVSESVPFKPLTSTINCDAIYTDNNGLVWIGISNQVYIFDKNAERDYSLRPNALIRKVTVATIDSILFNGTNYRHTGEGKPFITLEQPAHIKHELKFAYNRLEFEFSSPCFAGGTDDVLFSYMLEGEDREWSGWSNNTRVLYTYLRENTYRFRVKAKNVYGVESPEATFLFTVNPPFHRTTVAYLGYLILLSLFIYAIVSLNSSRLQKEKLVLERIVKERTAELVMQKEKIEEQHKNITSSIEYAQRIQSALLPPGDYVAELLPERFILFLPRDIVSGDFYWISRKNGRIITVAADCTGHGVPGGFMSMLGTAFLNEIVNKSPADISASEILNQLRSQVIQSLRQKSEASETQDGMDISLFILDQKRRQIEFAGANNSLIIIRNGEIIELKGDKMPIGIHFGKDEPFSNHLFDVFEGDVMYSFSDGFQDQFGGPEGKKFMSKNLKMLLLNIHHEPMERQKEILEETLLEWQGSNERVDDILIIGVRIRPAAPV